MPSSVIGDFEHYISHILNRVNSITGIAYKDDPTILGWETGNGLTAPLDWVQMIARYLKSIDPNHLVIDGNSGQSYDTPNFTPDVSISNVDVYTGQYYPLNIAELNKQADQAQKANKVFIAEEYAWNNKGGGIPSLVFSRQSRRITRLQEISSGLCSVTTTHLDMYNTTMAILCIILEILRICRNE